MSQAESENLHQFVEISFDCFPLRTINRRDIPLDASPKFQELYGRILAALDKHGAMNTYYLYNARCVYHLTNEPDFGSIIFKFEGTILTDSEDLKANRSDLQVELHSETCDWLTEPVVEWFRKSVRRSVKVEFNRYIDAGDLAKTKERLEKIQAQSDEQDGFIGMYL